MIRRFVQWLSGARKPAPFSEVLWQQTLSNYPFLLRLDGAEQLRLRRMSEQFLAEKEFTSAGGLELSDAMCVAIAVQGCLPVLNLGLENYRDWVGIVVYPDEFVVPRSVEDDFGVVHEYTDIASGEAWEGGPLLVSWQDVERSGKGYNVVIHEFAHKLDMLNGDTDGIPPLPREITRADWESTLHAAYEDFCRRVDEADFCEVCECYESCEDHENCEAARAPEEDGINPDFDFDPYASENPAEFFAVMSEAFFETPEVLRAGYPALYWNFCGFYRQDPAARDPRI